MGEIKYTYQLRLAVGRNLFGPLYSGPDWNEIGKALGFKDYNALGKAMDGGSHHSKIDPNCPIVQKLQMLLGPHGKTLFKAMKVRNEP